MKKTKLVVLLSLLTLTAASVAVVGTGCVDETPPPSQEQTAEHTFTFAGGEGATGTAPAAIEAEEGDTLTLPENPFTLADHTFAGWSDGTTTYQPGDSYTVGTTDVTFTAVWTATVTKYSVSYVGGEGATGTAPAQEDVAEGTAISLPEAVFSIEGLVMTGWTDGTDEYAPGAEYTVGAADVTFSPVWDLAEGTYSEYLSGMQYTMTVEDGIATYAWRGDYNPFEMQFTYTIDGDTVTFTEVAEEDATVIEATLYHGFLISTDWVGTWGTFGGAFSALGVERQEVSSADQSGYLYLAGDVVLVSVDVYGTCSREGDIYTASFNDGSTMQFKITPVDTGYGFSINFYVENDGNAGSYTYGSSTVVLDGYGVARVDGSVGSYGVMGSMIYLNDPDSGVAGIYAFDAQAATIGTEDLTGTVSYTDFANTVIYYDGTYVGTVSTNPYGLSVYNAVLLEDSDYTALGSVLVLTQESWDGSLVNSYYYQSVNALPEGTYVNNISSTGAISAVISGSTLAVAYTGQRYDLEAGGMVPFESEAEFTFAVSSSSIVFTDKDGERYDGTYINGAIYTTLPLFTGFMDTDTRMLLTQEAVSPVDGLGSAGYANNAVNMSQNLYLFTNGIAIYVDSSDWQNPIEHIGFASAADGLYTVQLIGELSPMVVRLTPAEEYSMPTYTVRDGLVGEYTLDDVAITLDGFGGWERADGTSGTYYAFTAGYSDYVLINDADAGTQTLYSSTWSGFTPVSAPAGLYVSAQADAPWSTVAYLGTGYDYATGTQQVYIGIMYSVQSGATTFTATTLTATLTPDEGAESYSATVTIEYMEYTILYADGVITVSWTGYDPETYEPVQMTATYTYPTVG